MNADRSQIIAFFLSCFSVSYISYLLDACLFVLFCNHCHSFAFCLIALCAFLKVNLFLRSLIIALLMPVMASVCIRSTCELLPQKVVCLNCQWANDLQDGRSCCTMMVSHMPCTLVEASEFYVISRCTMKRDEQYQRRPAQMIRAAASLLVNLVVRHGHMLLMMNFDDANIPCTCTT